MLAVVLSVGLVVDDAIVMTENIYIRIERGMSPFEAGIEGSQRDFLRCYLHHHHTGCGVLPIVFMDGTSGRLFREFSFVVGFGYHFFLRRINFHSYVGNQTIH